MNVNELTIEQLEDYRNQLQAEIENLRTKFTDAGKLIEQKKLAMKRDALAAEIAELNELAAKLEV